jgi:hypothetical protein
VVWPEAAAGLPDVAGLLAGLAPPALDELDVDDELPPHAARSTAAPAATAPTARGN